MNRHGFASRCQAMTVNQQEHLQCTWPAGYGVHTHLTAARELLLHPVMWEEHQRHKRPSLISSGAEKRAQASQLLPSAISLKGHNSPSWKARDFNPHDPSGEVGMPEASPAPPAWLSPWHSPGTPRGLGAAGRALCWGCLSRCSWRQHHQALSACHSGGHSSVAWSARRHEEQLFGSNTLAAPN